MRGTVAFLVGRIVGTAAIAAAVVASAVVLGALAGPGLEGLRAALGTGLEALPHLLITTALPGLAEDVAAALGSLAVLAVALGLAMAATRPLAGALAGRPAARAVAITAGALPTPLLALLLAPPLAGIAGGGFAVAAAVLSLTLAFPLLASVARALRDEAQAPHLAAARAVGLGRRRVRARHLGAAAPRMLPAGLGSVRSATAPAIAALIVVEAALARPGIGARLVEAAAELALPRLASCLLVIALLALVADLALSAVARAVDPRQRLGAIA